MLRALCDLGVKMLFLTADEPAFAKATAWQARMIVDSEKILNR
jgi:hypothetical protein